MNNKKLLFTTLFIVVGVIVVGVLAYQFLTVREVRVVAPVGVITDLGSAGARKFVFLVQKNDVIGEIAQRNPLAENIDVTIIFPSTFEIKASKRQPVVAIKNADTYFLTDKDGYIVSQEKGPGDLPILTIATADVTSEGLITNSTILKAIACIRIVSENGMEPRGATILTDENEVKISTKGTELLIPLSIDTTSLYSSLQLLTRQFRIEGNQPSSIDFRFNKPVVRF